MWAIMHKHVDNLALATWQQYLPFRNKTIPTLKSFGETILKWCNTYGHKITVFVNAIAIFRIDLLRPFAYAIIALPAFSAE